MKGECPWCEIDNRWFSVIGQTGWFYCATYQTQFYGGKL